MNTFVELSLSPLVSGNLARQGFVEPTPVQSQAIPPALEGRDVVATAQTGTGKTLAFVLPMLEALEKAATKKGIGAVVVSPTRELAIQTRECFETVSAGTGIRAALVVGGLNEKTQLQAIRKGARVLIATPGRLCDFLERRLIDLKQVRTLVLDEGDRMLDMGFLPDLKRIFAAVPAERQTLFFSATIESSVAHLVDRFLRNPVRVAVGSTVAPPTKISLHLYEVEQDSKTALLQDLLSADAGSFLVFTRTKHGADRLAKRLAREGVKAARIHGDRTQNQRNQALRGFQDGDYRVLVATDVAARGIHVDGISHVVNFDLPQVPEDFIHRVGRTGRAGAAGTASTFSTMAERGEIQRLERTLKVSLTRRGQRAKAVAAPEPAAAAGSRTPSGALKRRRPSVMSFGPNRRRRSAR